MHSIFGSVSVNYGNQCEIQLILWSVSFAIMQNHVLNKKGTWPDLTKVETYNWKFLLSLLEQKLSVYNVFGFCVSPLHVYGSRVYKVILLTFMRTFLRTNQTVCVFVFV